MFTSADIGQLVGTEVLARGEDYFARGHVVTVARNGDGTTIVGQVRGSGGKQYVAVVEMSSGGDQAKPRFGRCTCPVRLNCKHTAAVLIAYLDKQNPPDRPTPSLPSLGPRKTSEWERAFADLLEVPDAGGPATQARASARRAKPWDVPASNEIGLQFELLTESGRTSARFGAVIGGRRSEPRLGMRPVTRNAQGRWVRTGVSWSELRFLNNRHGVYPEGYIDVLRSLFGLAASVSDSAYFTAPAWVHVDELPSAAFWALMADARRVGLPLLHSNKAQTPILFTDDPAHTRLTVARAEDGGLVLTGHLLLDDAPLRAALVGSPEPAQLDLGSAPVGAPEADSATATRPHRPLDRSSLLFVGSPPTGLVTWTSASSPGKETLILLAQLADQVDDSALVLIDRTEPLMVPKADERTFLRRVLPALRARFAEVEVDPTIDLPEPAKPRLRLTLTHQPEHGVDLRWQWIYQVADTEAGFIGVAWGATPELGLRDLPGEKAICDRLSGLPHLPEPPDARPGGLRAWTRDLDLGPLGAGVEQLRGMDTALFYTRDLAMLQAAAAQDPDFELLTIGTSDIDYRLADNIEISVSTSALPETNDWFDLGVTIKAGTQQIPFADVFKALAQGRKYLLLVDGLHFSLDDDRFLRLRDLIEEARAMQDTMGGPLRVNRFQVGLFEELERLGVVGSQAQAWRSALGSLIGGAKPVHVDPPAGLTATMRSYQQEGFDWLVFLRKHGLGGILADDMGLGKTLQTLALIQHTQVADPDAPRRPFLVVAPTSVLGNWTTETAHFTPGLVAVAVNETRARRRKPLSEVVAGADIVVTSYALFRLDFEEYQAMDWAGLVLDEAQFVKNHQSVAYQCARRLRAPVKLALTGTPLENNLMELWSILSIVSPGLFPNPTRFSQYYARPIEKEGAADRLAQLRRRVAPFMLRRTKDDVAKDLPAKQEQVVDVVLNSRHRAVYDAYLQRERTKVLGLVEKFGEHRFEVFRSLTVLRQASLDVSLVDSEHAGVPSSKLDVLFEMLDDILAEGHSVLVFSQFTQFLGRVREHLDAKQVDYSYLDGRTRKRAETIERFTSGETSVFLISLKAGGFGLNLTAADYCILLDPWWNPAAEAQAVDRAHRIGQKRTVMVYRMVSLDTIEEKVMALKASKSKLFASVLDGGAAGGAGLTASDVRELLE